VVSQLLLAKIAIRSRTLQQMHKETKWAGSLSPIAIAGLDPHTQTYLPSIHSCAMQYKDRERHLRML
jgi:hypothetical protein